MRNFKSHQRFATILNQAESYYSRKIAEHGAIPEGVDWSSLESQEIRFNQILKVCREDAKFSLIDFGCGYGSLFSYLKALKREVDYLGFDISEAMVAKAKGLFQDEQNCTFFIDEDLLSQADYTVASGVFNVRQNRSDDEWVQYILATLDKFDRMSLKGFSFNILTKYSDREYMRPDLFYADPCFLFDYCKRNFSKNVALLHDYELYEFTMIVRK